MGKEGQKVSHPLKNPKFYKVVQSVPKDAVEQSYYGKIMIGPYWGSVDRLEVAGFDFCHLRTYFNTVISQLCFELEQI